MLSTLARFFAPARGGISFSKTLRHDFHDRIPF